MTDHKPLNVGVAGLGGYARAIVDLILECGPITSPRVRLVAACEPNLEAHAERVASLRRRGAQVVRTFEELIALNAVEAVWLPVPIDLHVPFAKAALRAGKAVMVEKPVAGTVDELDELIAARDAAGRPVAVGFQDVYDPATLPIKRRLLNGTLGRVQRASVRVCWPRSDAYFTRNAWAGAMRHRGAWVLDSPVNNAMAHFVNFALFLLGPTETASATPTSVEAELYRATEIENYDTASLRVRLAEGPELLVLMTHASLEFVGPFTEIHAERGGVRISQHQAVIRNGDREQTLAIAENKRLHMLDRFAKLARGIPCRETPVATLEVARAHALVVNGASEAAGIRTVPESHIVLGRNDGHVVRAIRGVADAFAHCAAEGVMLHESGRLAFTRPAGWRDLTGYTHFAGPLQQPDAGAARPRPLRLREGLGRMVSGAAFAAPTEPPAARKPTA